MKQQYKLNIIDDIRERLRAWEDGLICALDVTEMLLHETLHIVHGSDQEIDFHSIDKYTQPIIKPISTPNEIPSTQFLILDMKQCLIFWRDDLLTDETVANNLMDQSLKFAFSAEIEGHNDFWRQYREETRRNSWNQSKS